MIQRPDLVLSQALDAAVDGRECNPATQVGRVEVENKTDRPKRQWISGCPLEVRETVLGAIFFPQEADFGAKSRVFLYESKGNGRCNAFRILGVVLAA